MQKMIYSKDCINSMIGFIRLTYKRYGKGLDGMSYVVLFPDILYISGCLTADKSFLLGKIITNMFL